ncbi:hypothetical protein H8356DRAFT_1364249 [Neocallimastix lanati (nom. inval.)]|nr:hypothetical protein H8356DRAFT_1364249 [Neocallimastix sp. JGI-2020a]
MSVLGKLIKLIEKLKKRVKYKTVDKRKLLKVKESTIMVIPSVHSNNNSLDNKLIQNNHNANLSNLDLRGNLIVKLTKINVQQFILIVIAKTTKRKYIKVSANLQSGL